MNTPPLNPDQYEVLIKAIRETKSSLSTRMDNLEKTMLIHEENSSHDRDMFEDIKVRIGVIEKSLGDWLTQINSNLNKIHRSIESIVVDAVEKTTAKTFSAAADQIEAINLPDTKEKPIVKEFPKGIKDKLLGVFKGKG